MVAYSRRNARVHQIALIPVQNGIFSVQNSLGKSQRNTYGIWTGYLQICAQHHLSCVGFTWKSGGWWGSPQAAHCAEWCLSCTGFIRNGIKLGGIYSSCLLYRNHRWWKKKRNIMTTTAKSTRKTKSRSLFSGILLRCNWGSWWRGRSFAGTHHIPRWVLPLLRHCPPCVNYAPSSPLLSPHPHTPETWRLKLWWRG